MGKTRAHGGIALQWKNLGLLLQTTNCRRVDDTPAIALEDLPLSDMYTPYVFPSENGLRCGTRELNYGPHQWRGDFQFNISRYSQQQLMETSHRHLLHAEEGTWLNIDGFHMGIGGDDSWSPSVSAEFQLSAGRYHYQLVWCQK